MRSGRGSVLAISSDDPVLRWIGAFGLALSAGTALIVDLVGPGTGRTIAELAGVGPRLAELSPGRRGIATISGGHAEQTEIDRAVEQLASSWPAVVVRSDGVRWTRPTVVYRGVYPGQMSPVSVKPSVWQPSSGAAHERLPGVVLPRLRPSHVRAMLAGRRPSARSWIAGWERVWGMPWV